MSETEDSALGALIASAKLDQPGAAELARLRAKVVVPILLPAPEVNPAAPPPVEPLAGSGLAAAAAASKAPFWVAGLLAAVVGGGALYLQSSASPKAQGDDDDGGVARSEAATGELDASALPATRWDSDAGPSNRKSTTTPSKRPSKALADSDPLAETKLLEDAQRAIHSKRFDAALRALRAHQKRFPHGTFGEERERLAVEALLGKGERKAANKRARHFERTYPQSVQLPRIRALLETAQ